jgi:phospholipase/carboxylesterase
MELLYTAHVPAGEGPHPTVIALHGWGASAHDLLGLAPAFLDGKALVLCPQGPVAIPFGGGQFGYGWFPLDPSRRLDPEEFQHGATLLRTFLDQAAEAFPIDPKRLVVLGFSQGGVMGYELALRDPARFAGLVALSSWLPGALSETLEPRPEHASLPVLVLHGTQDTLLEVERGRESREELRKLGVSMTYREFEMGHEIRPEALRVVQKWLEARLTEEGKGS